jgi:hypothetical protein
MTGFSVQRLTCAVMEYASEAVTPVHPLFTAMKSAMPA